MPKLHHLSPALQRQKRVRAKLHGTAQRPRVSVHRSNRHMMAQVIDDVAGLTLTTVSSRALAKTTGTKTEIAGQVGQTLAEQLKSKKITSVIFDRGRFRYHGRVKAVAEVLRQEGLLVWEILHYQLASLKRKSFKFLGFPKKPRVVIKLVFRY